MLGAGISKKLINPKQKWANGIIVCPFMYKKMSLDGFERFIFSSETEVRERGSWSESVDLE